MSGPQPDIRQEIAEAIANGDLLDRDEAEWLWDRLAAVENRCSDPAYVFDVGVACIRVSDIRAALGAAVERSPE